MQIGPGRCDALLTAPYGAANGNKGLTAVPSHLFKLVYDEERNVAWAHWHANSDDARGSELISYAELVRRTGVDFLPGVVQNIVALFQKWNCILNGDQSKAELHSAWYLA